MGKYLVVNGENCMGATEIATTLAVMTAFVQTEKCLLMNTGKLHQGIERGIVSKHRSDNLYHPLADQGMDALARLIQSGRLNVRNMQDFTKPLIRNRLDLASGYSYTARLELEERSVVNQEVVRIASECYPHLFLHHPDWTKMLEQLGTSDVGIVVLRQDREILERFFEHYHSLSHLQDRSIIVAIYHYDVHATLSVRNIKRMFGCHAPIVGVPYLTGFANAWNNAEMLSFIQRNHTLPAKSSPNGEHMESIKQLVHACLKITAPHSSLVRKEVLM